MKSYSDTKAEKLKTRLLAEIHSGSYKAGSFLPPEQELAESYAVSRPTMRKAIDSEELAPFLKRIAKRGVQVLPGEAARQEERKEAPATRIAFVSGYPPDESIVQLDEGMRFFCRSRGIGHELCLCETHAEARGSLRSLKDRGLAGIAIFPGLDESYRKALGSLAEKGYPLVCVDRRVEGVEACSVESDNFAGAYLATKHLIETHRRPAWYLGGAKACSPTFARREGYRKAMENAGFGEMAESHMSFDEDNDWKLEAWKGRWRGGAIAADRIFAAGPELPVLAVCENDYFAQGLYVVAKERKLAVGREVFVTGFDDLPLAALQEPPLTTIRQSFFEMGMKAAELLLAQIEGKLKQPLKLKTPVELIVRKSSVR